MVHLSYSGRDEFAAAINPRPLPARARSVCTWFTAFARSSRRFAGEPPGRRKNRMDSTIEANPASPPSEPGILTGLIDGWRSDSYIYT